MGSIAIGLTVSILSEGWKATGRLTLLQSNRVNHFKPPHTSVSLNFASKAAGFLSRTPAMAWMRMLS